MLIEKLGSITSWNDPEVGSNLSTLHDSVNYNTTSDKRRKKNIESLENSIETVKKIHPVKFHWKRNENDQEPEDKRKTVGFIAQELQPLVPEAVSGVTRFQRNDAN